MARTSNSLRQVLIDEVARLNGAAVRKRNFIVKIINKYPQFTRSYVTIYLNKCIVNSSSRDKWWG